MSKPVLQVEAVKDKAHGVKKTACHQQVNALQANFLNKGINNNDHQPAH